MPLDQILELDTVPFVDVDIFITKSAVLCTDLNDNFGDTVFIFVSNVDKIYKTVIKGPLA